MNTARKQIRLSIPVSASEKAMARKLANAHVDGAKNVTQLVKKLLADRFKRYLDETAKGGAKKAAVVKVKVTRGKGVKIETPPAAPPSV